MQCEAADEGRGITVSKVWSVSCFKNLEAEIQEELY